jgi:hypothetical protein
MLFIVCAMGLVGAIVIGLDGLMLGSAGELERIAAIACFALAAAGLVGVLADDGRRTRRPRSALEPADVFQLVAAAPILAIMVGTFVATLLPAIYVMLPFFAVSGSEASRRRVARAQAGAGAAPTERLLPTPAFT